MSRSPSFMPTHPRRRETGLTLIELMIAITISLIVLAALTAMFVTSSRARDEITRANQQIENGRYAMQVLSEDIALAGFMGRADLREGLTLWEPGTPPTLSAAPVLSFTNNRLCGADDVNVMSVLRQQAPLYIEGLNNVAAASMPADCTTAGNFAGGSTMSNFKPGTDMLVIRRTSTCTAYPPPTACPPVVGLPYFQVSLCPESAPDQALPHIATLGVEYTLQACPANCDTNRAALEAVFNLNDRIPGGGCSAATNNAEVRRYLTHIYFVDNDAVLNRAELTVDGGVRKFTVVPIAEGIDNFQVQYGVDPNEDGVPNSYEDASAINAILPPNEAVATWRNVVTARIYILARSTDPSPGHVDNKTYVLGSTTVANPNDNFKRHVFESLVQIRNPSGLRQP
jgi:type IV pilus assembly protein PilW